MSGGFRFGEWQADIRTRSLTSPRQTLRLERKAMEVLTEMARAAPGSISSEELMARVWSGVVVGDGALYRVIALLRKVLGDDSRNPKYIESIPRHGYRLLVPVCFEGAPAPGGPDGRHLSLRRFSVFVDCRSGAGDPVALELASRIGRYVDWSNGAFKVLRQPADQPTEHDYQLSVGVVAREPTLRVRWELLRGGSRELVWASDHGEAAGDFPAKQDRIAELIAEGVVKSIRRCRLAEWDRDPQSPSMSYWDLVLLADHYRSMEPADIEARRLMLRRALSGRPDVAPAHAAFADFLSWEVANGICADAQAALMQMQQEASTAVDIDSHDPYVLSRCGVAYSRTGDYWTGVELCRRAYALASSTASRETLATTLCFAGGPEEAIAHYEDLLQTMPAGHVFQYGKLVVALVQSARLEEALEYSQHAVIHFPKDYFCWGLRANLLAQFGALDEAEAAFAQARALMPTLTLASLIDGTNRTYGRTSEQQDLLTDGLMHLLNRQSRADAGTG